MVKQRTGDVLRSADRLFRVLEWFTPERPSGSASEIARDLDIAAATVRRLLALLESRRFLQRDPTLGTYRIGFAPLRLAAIARGSSPFIRAAQDELDRLQETVGELVIYAILDGADVVHVDVRESTFPLRVHRAVGRRVRADEGGAVGAILLAWLPDEQLDHIIASRSELVPSAEDIRATLETIRRRGYAVNPGTAFNENVWAVAMPVRDVAGRPVASLGLVAPSSRAGRERQREMIDALRRSTSVISERLGWMDDRKAI